MTRPRHLLHRRRCLHRPAPFSTTTTNNEESGAPRAMLENEPNNGARLLTDAEIRESMTGSGRRQVLKMNLLEKSILLFFY